jgi:transposase
MANKARNVEIMRLVRNGFSYAQVAKKVGCSRSVVAGVVCRSRTDRPNPDKVQHAWRYGAAKSIVQAARDEGMRETAFRMAMGLRE